MIPPPLRAFVSMGICYSTKTLEEEEEEDDGEAEGGRIGEEEGEEEDFDGHGDEDATSDEEAGHETLEAEDEEGEEDGDVDVDDDDDEDEGEAIIFPSEAIGLRAKKNGGQETIAYEQQLPERQRKPSLFFKGSSSSSSSLSPFRPSPFRASSPFKASPGNGSFANGVRRPYPPPSPSKHIQAALFNRHGIDRALPEHGFRTLEQSSEPLFGYSKEFSARYELGEEIGRGHFGYTCKAKVKKGGMKGQTVAVKIISKSKMTTAIAIDDVRREVKIYRALSGHRTFIRFYDAYEDDWNVYMVMELCEGGELLDRILERGGRYPEEEAKDVIVQILSAVAFFHLQGVVHRDLKPENFLYTSKEENAKLKAIDFGLSDFVRPDERLNDIVGSAYYVAPEVLRKSYSIEADLWSVGVITYILLSGSRPFWARTESGIFRAVLKTDPSFDETPWPLVSNEAKDFVRRLLTKNRHKRMTAAQALAHHWVRGHKRVPLDILVFRSVKSYLCSSIVRRRALKAFGKTLSEDELFYLRAQFRLMEPGKSGRLSHENFTSALMKNATEAMNDSRMLEMMSSISMNGLQLKMDFEEFCGAAISIPQFEGSERWEAQVNEAYEIFENAGNRVVMIEDLAKELGVPTTIPAHVVLRDWVRHSDGKLSFFAFTNLLRGMSPQTNPY